ncbi:aromatic amino acid-specific transport protein [Candidatus Protochlamydia naegleriophila]|uniref:Aromatic amino acid-specific transport protein n=1 Tax=Candidatus Protochlamydia naegleriophila TaxID=389348 RepID=A0A0U5JEV5_9BACT|nr:aromatic amino acid transport family protein [Candidatus Protochlamydia naegleriophila]CUI17332.1 aromatic amino acid-specific transport protein [Candidatus Protochlamydia naegleriophila]
MEEKETASQNGSLISAMFLVAGTCTGGGMLALPVATGISGFVPSAVVMACCWFAMTVSALLLLEVNLWMKEGAHVITMSSTILGPIGRIVSWIVYLFISYASIVAYTAAGGSLVVNGAANLMGFELTKELGCLLFIVCFGSIIYIGSRFVGRVNTILFVAMIVAYFALVSTGVSEVKTELLSHRRWTTSFLAIPLLLTTFSFQTMLPSLTPYLKRNANALRWAIVGGTTITFAVYLIWQYMVLGIVPVAGPNSLLHALEVGEPVTQFLREHVKSEWVSHFAEYFAFFALVTSFLGMALGLIDFLSDGLNIKKTGLGKAFLGFLIVVPTYIFAAYFERVFLVALDTSGGFGDSILNGIMPVLMVWVGRYYLKFPNENRVPGGKPLLLIVLAFFALSLVLETLIHTGYICSIFEACQIILNEKQPDISF